MGLVDRSQRILSNVERFKTIIVFILGGLVVWLIHGVMDYLFFYDRGFLDILVFSVPVSEVYHRVMVLAIFFTAGIFFLNRERMLRERDREWYNSFNSLEDVMLIVDSDYSIERINKAGLELLGKSEEEVLGKKCYEVIHDVDEPKGFCPFKDKQGVSGELEAGERTATVFGRYFSITSSPILDESGNVIRSVDLMRDITERKLYEDRLQALHTYSNEMHRASDIEDVAVTTIIVIVIFCWINWVGMCLSTMS